MSDRDDKYPGGGFSLCLVIAIICLIAAIAIPKDSLASNESRAKETLRTILTEQKYRGEANYVRNTEELKGVLPWVNCPPDGPLQQAGYCFVVDPNPAPNCWACYAYPVEPCVTGVRVFRINQNEVLEVLIPSNEKLTFPITVGDLKGGSYQEAK